jgi:uncharacterized membrane protein YfcA
VGVLSAVAGIGGGVLMVPFLYLVYARTGASLSAQTVVAHATSLGVAFVTSTVGSWRYARAGAVVWQAAFAYAAPGILSAFVTARLLASAEEATWIRAGFGAFLLVSAWDMARRARHPASEAFGETHPHSWIWLVVFGFVGGALSALLGIGGGLVAVPVLLYVGKFPVRAVAPTALAAVCLTTLAGGIGYATAGPGPALSSLMAGFLDLRMAIPLMLGAVLTVPIGVRFNRQSSPPTLYWSFAALLAAIGLPLIWQWARGLPP